VTTLFLKVTKQTTGLSCRDSTLLQSRVADQAVDGSLKLPCVSATMTGNVAQRPVAQLVSVWQREGFHQLPTSAFGRFFNFANQPANKASCQLFAVFGKQSWVSIACQHQLTAMINHLLDRMQKFFLSGIFVTKEFDVIDQQNIDVAKTLPK
jgi:hypothetical protein